MVQKLILILLLLCSYVSTFAQEMWGVVSGNYAGINASWINPASTMHSKLYLDINLATADLFFENNAIYMHKGDFKPFSFIRSGDNLPQYGKDDLPFDYYKNTERKNLYLNALVQGPSFSVVMGDHAFGLRTSVRSILSGREIPYEMVGFAYEGLNYEPQQNINYNDNAMRVNGMSWLEIAFHYARNIVRQGDVHISAGINAKLLFGVAGAYLGLENLDYIVNNDSTLNLRNVRGELGYSSFSGNQLFNGNGFGFDLGVIYEKKNRYTSSARAGKLCRQPYEDYKYRLGLSLLDLGMINYKADAQKHNYNDVGVFWENVDTVQFRDIDQFTRMLSNQLYGDPGASLSANKIRVVLPMAASAQFDYHFRKQWYVNATAVQPLFAGKTAIYRPAQLSVTPRYESQYFEFSLPISLYDYRYPRLGLSARFWFLTIGSDNLLGFFSITDFTGFDIYASIKFNFLKGKCRGSSWHCDYRNIRSR